MNWRISLFLLLLAALGAGYWWLDGVMATQAWAVATDEKWRIAGTGWETLKHAWPVAVAGLLIGGVLVLFTFGYLYFSATEADHENELNRMKAELEREQKRVSSAESRAKALYQEKMSAAEQIKSSALKTQADAEELKAKAIEAVKQAQKQVEQANLTANDAEKRRQNATAAAARRKRQAERLKSKGS